MASQESVLEAPCWICYGTDKDMPGQRWVRPCKCKGTMARVHETCVLRWIDTKGGRNRDVCPQCKARYKVLGSRPQRFVQLGDAYDTVCQIATPAMAMTWLAGSVWAGLGLYGGLVYAHVYRLSLRQLMQRYSPWRLFALLPVIPIGVASFQLITQLSVRVSLDAHNTYSLTLTHDEDPDPWATQDDEEQQEHQRPSLPGLFDPAALGAYDSDSDSDSELDVERARPGYLNEWYDSSGDDTSFSDTELPDLSAMMNEELFDQLNALERHDGGDDQDVNEGERGANDLWDWFDVVEPVQEAGIDEETTEQNPPLQPIRPFDVLRMVVTSFPLPFIWITFGRYTMGFFTSKVAPQVVTGIAIQRGITRYLTHLYHTLKMKHKLNRRVINYVDE
eukprot:m.47746 g.47746  ORF g.47746 m.47746 type:complete len:391 (+) comp10994_c0_seq2:714-1886(+)